MADPGFAATIHRSQHQPNYFHFRFALNFNKVLDSPESKTPWSVFQDGTNEQTNNRSVTSTQSIIMPRIESLITIEKSQDFLEVNSTGPITDQ